MTPAIDILLFNGIDQDAREFCVRSGALDRRAISAFVKGIKTLGLWNSMVCWPLRSSQNAGTGTTAYSLGGLGTYNGTLVNGPTWGMDGITCTAEGSSRITTPTISALSNPFSVISVILPSTYVATSQIFSFSEVTDEIGLVAALTGAVTVVGIETGSTNNIWSTGSTVPTGTYAFLRTSFLATTKTFGVNAGTSSSIGTTVAMDPALKNMAFGVRIANGLRAFDHTQAAQFVINGILSDATMASVYALYKSALGQGLALP